VHAKDHESLIVDGTKRRFGEIFIGRSLASELSKNVITHCINTLYLATGAARLSKSIPRAGKRNSAGECVRHLSDSLIVLNSSLHFYANMTRFVKFAFRRHANAAISRLFLL
jgi:hypothetical protein